MEIKQNRLFGLLLIGCVLGSCLSLPTLAADGIIVILRTVQPRNATVQPMVPDPNPTTANANPSKYILPQTNELSDGDFANVSTGMNVRNSMIPGGTVLNSINNGQTQTPGMAAGHSGGANNGIANMVNQNVQQGLGALKVITGGQ
ncbi:hypothetical protein [Pseudomonas sp. NA-150]|uniref:hypothetical protein n=1 Tax=Pseudomonas sp. NA-150 TaxID=3367525 RepID=UPI0037C99D92